MNNTQGKCFCKSLLLINYYYTISNVYTWLLRKRLVEVTPTLFSWFCLWCKSGSGASGDGRGGGVGDGRGGGGVGDGRGGGGGVGDGRGGGGGGDGRSGGGGVGDGRGGGGVGDRRGGGVGDVQIPKIKFSIH